MERATLLSKSALFEPRLAREARVHGKPLLSAVPRVLRNLSSPHQAEQLCVLKANPEYLLRCRFRHVAVTPSLRCDLFAHEIRGIADNVPGLPTCRERLVRGAAHASEASQPRHEQKERRHVERII